MASNNRGRARFGRMFSPRRRSATPIEGLSRRERRVKRWRERFRRFSLSSWQSTRIVETVCAMFRSGAEAARLVSGATGTAYAGAAYGRSLRLESLEARQMLAIDVAVIYGDGLLSDPENEGYVALAAQLNDDTHFDFNATLISPATAAAGLGAYDAVVVGNNGLNAAHDLMETYSAELKAYVEAGGGLVFTGWGIWGAQGASLADIDSIVPVNVASSFQNVVNTGMTVDVDPSAHQIADGVADFNAASWYEVPDDVTLDPGATQFATLNGQPAGVAAHVSLGRSVYLGPTYTGAAGYNPAALRSGDHDRLLEQAVAWVAVPSDEVFVDDDWTVVVDIGAPGLSPGDTVSSDNDGDGDDTTNFANRIYGYTAFSSIQDAVDSVGEGGTVHVNAGTFAENVDITTAGVTVLGINQGLAGDDAGRGLGSILAGSGAGFALTISAPDVVVDGLDIVDADDTEAGNSIGVAIGGGGSGVEFRNNVVSAFITGIYLSSGHADGLIEGNLITGNANGILFEGTLTDTTINDNRIVDNDLEDGYWNGRESAGIRVLGDLEGPGAEFDGTNVVVSNNTIAGSLVGVDQNSVNGFTLTDNSIDATAAYVVNAAAGSLDATDGNLFGGVDPATASLDQLFDIEDRIVHGVDVSVLGLVRVVDGQVFVTPNSFLPPFTTAPSIQSGVDAADAGDTLHVQAGAYTGDVTVGKALTILGAQAGVDPASRTPGDAAETTSAGSISVGASDVTISGFSVDGSSGGVHGIGETTSTTGNVYSDNFIYDFSSLGIAIAAGSTGFLVTGNNVSNNYAGVYLSANSTGGTIRDNVITGHIGAMGSDEGAGIVLEGDNTDISITGNEVSGNRVGVYVWTGLGSDLTGTAVTGNSITGNTDAAVENTNSATLNASGNWWGSSDLATITATMSGLVDYSPFLNSGADTDTAAGFQGDFSSVTVHLDGEQVGGASRIHEAAGLVASGGTVHILEGSYTGDVDTSGNAVNLEPALGVAQVTIDGNLTLDADDSLSLEIDGLSASGPVEFDNLVVTGDVDLGGATLNVDGGFTPLITDTFTIIDVGGTLTGAFAGTPGAQVDIGGVTFQAANVGGDVVLVAFEATVDLRSSSDSVSPNTNPPGTNTDNITNINTPTFDGTSVPGATIALFAGAAQVGSGVADANGNWSITLPVALLDGTHSITAQATDPFNTVTTAALLVTIDTLISANAKPDMTPETDHGDYDDDNITNDNTPTFVGEGGDGATEPGAFVELIVDGVPVPGATTNADANGAWEITPINAIPNGIHMISVRVTDIAGNVAVSLPLQITIDTTVPAATSQPDLIAADDSGAFDDDDVTYVANPTFTGTGGEPNRIVELYSGATLIGSTVAAADGSWTISVVDADPNTAGDQPLADGVHNIVARARDLAGNLGTPSLALAVTIDTTPPFLSQPDLDPTSDTGVSDGDNVTSATELLLNGQAEADAEVEILQDGVVIGTVTADGAGDWSFTTAALADGTYGFAASSTDLAGNTTTTTELQVTVDTTNPDAPVFVLDAASDSGSSDSDGITNVVLPTIGGVTEPGASVEVSLGMTVLGTATADMDGNWSLTLQSGDELTHGVHEFSAVVTDLAGNVSDPGTLEIEVDIVDPTADGGLDQTNVAEGSVVNLTGVGADADSGVASEIWVFVSGPVTVADGVNPFDFTPADNGVYVFEFTVTDVAGNVTTDQVSVSVDNVAPVIDSIEVTDGDEGSPVTLSGTYSDAGSNDTHVLDIDWGDGSPTETVVVTGGVFSVQHTYADDNPTGTPADDYIITVLLKDDDSANDTESVTTTISNVAPVVELTGATLAEDGQTVTYTFTTTDVAADTFDLPVIDAGGHAVSNVVFDSNTGSGSFDVTFTSPGFTSTATISIEITDDDTGVGSDSLEVTISDTLQVINFEQTTTGFKVTFNRDIDTSVLNLYSGLNLAGPAFGASDLIVTGNASGAVKGSVVWDDATNTLTWVKTGGILADDSYTVTLVSSTDAFRDLSGEALDGDGDLVAGDDFVQNFSVATGSVPIVSLPDFARGPNQVIDVTPGSAVDASLPIGATGLNVQGISFDLIYDTALLSIDPQDITALLTGWTVASTNLSVDMGGIATLTVVAAMSTPGNAFTGFANVVDIIATVPADAPYGSSQIVQIADAEVNEIAALADAAIQKVLYLGDANASNLVGTPASPYTAFDASLIARVVAGLDTGFHASPLVDPTIIGDASGNGQLGSLDVSLIFQESAGYNTSQVPDIAAPGSGAVALLDPEFSIPDNILVKAGESVEIPVNITIEETVQGIVAATFTVDYDPAVLDFDGVELGDDFGAGDGWDILANETSPGSLRISMFSINVSDNNGGNAQNLAKLNFNVLADAATGSSLLDIEPVDPNEAGLVWTEDDGSVFVVPTGPGVGDYNGDGVVDAADYTVWRDTRGQEVDPSTGADGDGDGVIGDGDYLVWKGNFGTTYGEGSGAVAFAASSVAVAPAAEAPVLAQVAQPTRLAEVKEESADVQDAAFASLAGPIGGSAVTRSISDGVVGTASLVGDGAAVRMRDLLADVDSESLEEVDAYVELGDRSDDQSVLDNVFESFEEEPISAIGKLASL